MRWDYMTRWLEKRLLLALATETGTGELVHCIEEFRRLPPRRRILSGGLGDECLG